MLEIAQGISFIKKHQKIVALTGAGVSVPSGIPDYRSVKGVYDGLDQPEYLLSRSCLENEPAKFYTFVKNLYHLEAQPNIIHQELAELTREGGVITQNIDQLHQSTNDNVVVEFHGSLHRSYCLKCLDQVSVAEYLKLDKHVTCGGQLRPDIVLYGEGLFQTT